MKKIMIIGGSGSWGQELTKQLLSNAEPDFIKIYSRGEHKQVEMARRFNDDRLKFIIGDIRDKNALKHASRDVDTIFHLAALKHVPVCELNPEETIKTNILGTLNAVEVSIENNVDRFILVSTDKAVDPINVYGVSKSAAEKLVINANYKSGKTKFVCIRGGNVLGSNGSVVPLFQKQILTANKVTITDEKMTRFFMRLEEAISLIFKALNDSIGGEIYVLKMPSINVLQLADIMISELGDSKTVINNIGIRPGEKMNEVLVSRYESSRTYSFEDYFVILPNLDIPALSEKYASTPALNKEYNSLDNKYLTNDELKTILKKEGWMDGRRSKDLEDYSEEELLEYFKRERWQK